MHLIVTLRVLIASLAFALMATGCDLTAPKGADSAGKVTLADLFTPVPRPEPILAPMSAFQKGIVYASWWHGEYSSPESDRTLSLSISPMGVNWIAIVVTCYQKKVTSTQIQCLPQSSTPTDADLTHVIQYAHRLGLRVMLKPHIDLADDAKHWRGEIGFGHDEAAWQAWFGSYTDFITHYASIAQSTGADYFVVGTELVKTARRADEWRNVIKEVRHIYSGPLTYAAHHASVENNINWWDALDAIGIDAYYSLAQNAHPTVAQIKAIWAPIVVRLGKLSKKWGRQVILTEIGYQSLEGTSRTPWSVEGHIVKLEEQADSYQAVFEAFAGQKWWHGVFWWVWIANSSQCGELNADFTACNKPAEDILRENYGVQRRPNSIAAPVVAAKQKAPLTIYHNALSAGWEDWSWNTAVDQAFRERAPHENTALKVSMKPWGALSLHSTGTDTSPYHWLEFYIYVGNNIGQRFVVSFNDKSDHELPLKIDLPNPRFIENGKLIADQWQRVRIPLADIGASNTTITRLNIKDESGKVLREFFIDEIRLVGAAGSTDKPSGN